MGFKDIDRQLKIVGETLKNLLDRIPTITDIHASTGRIRPESTSGDGPQLEVSFVREGVPERLLCIWIPTAQPRHVRGVAGLLRFDLDTWQDPPTYPVLAGPYISETSAAICEDAGMGYIDPAGNCHLEFGNVYVDKRVADNPFRDRRDLRSILAPKSSRVLRVMLTPPLKTWKVKELEQAAQVSLGLVSKLRQAFIDREWAIADDEGIRLLNPELVLRNWGANYVPSTQLTVPYYTPLHGNALEVALKDLWETQPDGTLLRSYSAARWLAPFGRQATTLLYARHDTLPRLKRSLKLVAAPGGENVLVRMEPDEDIFSAALEPAPGIHTTSLIHTWLDLKSSGERGEEAAEHLLREKLLPGWKHDTKSK